AGGPSPPRPAARVPGSHRPCLAPALGLRAGTDAPLVVSQTTSCKETPIMLLPDWPGFLRLASPPRPAEWQRGRRRLARRLYLEPLEDRCLLATGLSAALVADIVPGPASSDPEGLTNVAGTLYFGALDSSNRWGLWASDGTGPGTALVKGNLPGYL